MSSVMGREALNGGEIALNNETAVRVAEYVCGLLEPTEHAQVHVLLSRDDNALGVALAWEDELLSLVDALPPEHPPAGLRQGLQRTLGIGPPPAPPQTQLLRRRSLEAGATSADASPAASLAAGSEASKSMAASNVARSQAAAEAPSEANAGESALRAAATSATAGDASAATTATATAYPFDHTTQAKPEPPAATTISRVAAAEPPRHAGASQAPAHPASAPRATTASPTDAASSPSSAGGAASAQRPSGSPRAGVNVEAGAGLPPPANHGSTERTPRERVLNRKLWFWRLIGLAATAAAIVGFMIPREPPPPPVNIVKVAPTRAAILLAPGTSSTPAWTATFDADGNLMMQPLVNTEVPAGSQTLLWTRSARIPEPRLLGAIDPNRPVQVPAATFGQPADDQLLEITLETDEDAVSGTPNGPILYIGQMTTFGSEASATGAAGGTPGTSRGTSGTGVSAGTPAGNPAGGEVQGTQGVIQGPGSDSGSAAAGLITR